MRKTSLPSQSDEGQEGMWLKKLQIRNFRKIEELTIVFPEGMSVIVGENNSGKTAIIDALRVMLFPSWEPGALRVCEDDFRTGSDYAPIEIFCVFTGLTEEDEVHFQECLVDIGEGKFEMRVNTRITFNTTTSRCTFRSWGGETEGGSLPSNHFDRLAAIYLQPLRDPERGLRPGQHSQVARLVDCLTPEDAQDEFETIANDANQQIRKLGSVKGAKKSINSQMSSIAGEELAQQTDLVFTDPSFRRIIAGLQPEIAGLPFALNGLGYNNLVFASATLGTLRQSSQYSFRSILIEEPEAHLHPQLQVLLLRHFANSAENQMEHAVQVIASSHSPILASQAPINSIVAVREDAGQVNAISVHELSIDKTLKRKLERYLDATRCELFFARRVLMVEGIAEALLLPIFAQIAGGCLKESAVTVLNVEGLNFNAFLPLFSEEGIQAPVVVLTDGDASCIGGEISDTSKGLKALEKTTPRLRVEMSNITLEHELARSAAMLPHMLKALKELHPEIGADLERDLAKLSTGDEKADEFRRVFVEKKVKKGRFAQELASILDEQELAPNDVPQYIRNALQYLGVVAKPPEDENA